MQLKNLMFRGFFLAAVLPVVSFAEPILIDFDNLPYMENKPGTVEVPTDARLSTQLVATTGAAFSSQLGYVAIVQHPKFFPYTSETLVYTNIIGGTKITTISNKETEVLSYGTPITITFQDPQNGEAPAVTDFVSLNGDVQALAGATATMKAFDINGKSLGVDTENDVDGGMTLSISAPGIHSVVVTQDSVFGIYDGTIGFDNLQFNPVVPLASIDFDAIEGIIAMDDAPGQTVPDQAALNNQLLDTYHVTFGSLSDYVAVVAHPGAITAPYAIGGVKTDHTLSYGSQIYLGFRDPANSSLPGVTDYVSIRGIASGVVVATATMEAFDSRNESLGVDTEQDSEDGLVLTISAPNISYVIITQNSATETADGTIAFDNLYFKPVQTIDVSPDAIVFNAITGAEPNVFVESNTVTIAGLATSAELSIEGGEYSLNDSPFSVDPGFINNGDTIKVRVKSSANALETVTMTLGVGNASVNFSVTTKAAQTDTTPKDNNPPKDTKSTKKKGGGAWGVPELLFMLLAVVLMRQRRKV